jgi:hypothetical protein
VRLTATGLPLDQAPLKGGFQFAVNTPPRNLFSAGPKPCENPMACGAVPIKSRPVEKSPVSQIRFLIPSVPIGLAKCARSIGVGGGRHPLEFYLCSLW